MCLETDWNVSFFFHVCTSKQPWQELEEFKWGPRGGLFCPAGYGFLLKLPPSPVWMGVTSPQLWPLPCFWNWNHEYYIWRMELLNCFISPRMWLLGDSWLPGRISAAFMHKLSEAKGSPRCLLYNARVHACARHLELCLLLCWGVIRTLKFMSSWDMGDNLGTFIFVWLCVRVVI